jgi:hypothetical protein
MVRSAPFAPDALKSSIGILRTGICTHLSIAAEVLCVGKCMLLLLLLIVL